jgi:FAD:protein FMN transferase
LFGKRRPQRLVEHYEPVLGTVMELQIVGNSQASLDRQRDLVLGGIERLEEIFSVFRDESELNRLNRTCGIQVEVSAELASVLEDCLESWRISNGVFHPCAGALSAAWRDGHCVDKVVEFLQVQPYVIEGTQVNMHTHLPLNLNAVAKGYIVDELAATAFAGASIFEAMVNIGGDIRHLGEGGLIVDVLDPRSNAANAEVVSRVRVCHAGFATSGRAMRPIQLGNREISHVFDPRTGEPVEHWAGVSVLSSSARLADILATTLMVLSFDEGLELVADMEGTEFLAVDQDGEKFTSPGWSCLMR